MATKTLENKKSQPLVVIVGQTASGKSDLAIKIAKKYNGEVICADSRTIYKGMDIGTAKPSLMDRGLIRHYLLDIIEPDQTYSASDFKNQAASCLKDIHSRSKLPIITGGTGLYINSLIYDFDFGRPPDPLKRKKLQSLSMTLLQRKAEELGITEEQINFKNKRHLVRAIENGGIKRSKKQLRENTLLVGLRLDDKHLKQRISSRIERMIDIGLEAEVRTLSEKYGWNAPGLNTIAYKEWRGYFNGKLNINDVKENMFKNNWQYARRQKTWFKKDVNIHWFTSGEPLIRQVDQFLIQY
jgi:tRNA dimethylallyltransferase